MDRIAVMVDEYDVTGVQDLVRGQIAITTALETEYSHLRLELADLREFVAADDRWESVARQEWSDIDAFWAAREPRDRLRQQLANEYGLAVAGERNAEDIVNAQFARQGETTNAES